MSYVSSLPPPRLLCTAVAKLANEQLLRSSLHTRHRVTFDHSHLEPSTIGAADFFPQSAPSVRPRDAVRAVLQLDSDTRLHTRTAWREVCHVSVLVTNGSSYRRGENKRQRTTVAETNCQSHINCCAANLNTVRYKYLVFFTFFLHLLSFLSLRGHYLHY